MPKRIVIIGGGTAGASAAFAARKADRTAEITILEKEPNSTYSRCGLPFAIKGTIQSMDNLVVFPSRVYAAQRIIQKLQTEVLEINHPARQLTFKYIQTGDTETIAYDSGEATVQLTQE